VARVLKRCAVLTLATGAIEAAGGVFTGSLALLGDAGHMATDGLALTVAWLAARLASRRPPEAAVEGAGGAGDPDAPERSEAWAAIVNAALLLGLSVGLAVEASSRLAAPPRLLAWPAIAVAVVGLLVNLTVLRWLGTVHGTLNVRAARWHVLGDLLGSLSALAAGVLALAGVWPAADPVLALGIAALLLVAVLRLVREAYDVLRVQPRG
jgi:cobalt-zinc-cadmium efflux system protein